MPVISSINSPEIYQWLEKQIPNLDEASLIEIIKVKDMYKSILKLALNRLQDQDSEAWEDVVENAVDIYSQTLELGRLAQLFSTNPVLVLAHPYEALLVYHLISANGDST